MRETYPGSLRRVPPNLRLAVPADDLPRRFTAERGSTAVAQVNVPAEAEVLVAAHRPPGLTLDATHDLQPAATGRAARGQHRDRVAPLRLAVAGLDRRQA